MMKIFFAVLFCIGFLMFTAGGIASAMAESEKIKWDPDDRYYEASFTLGGIGSIGFLLCILL